MGGGGLEEFLLGWSAIVKADLAHIQKAIRQPNVLLLFLALVG